MAAITLKRPWCSSGLTMPSSWSHLLHMPNDAFAIALGLGGQTIMLKTASTHLGAASSSMLAAAATALWWLTGCGLVALSALSLLKAKAHPRFVRREFRDGSRFYFSFAPHLALLMLGLGAPTADGTLEWTDSVHPGRIVWATGFCFQCALGRIAFVRWLTPAPSSAVAATSTSPAVAAAAAAAAASAKGSQSLGHVTPLYMLSTVGWFLLAVYGSTLKLPWGGDPAAACFGCGVFTYIVVVSWRAMYKYNASTASIWFVRFPRIVHHELRSQIRPLTSLARSLSPSCSRPGGPRPPPPFTRRYF